MNLRDFFYRRPGFDKMDLRELKMRQSEIRLRAERTGATVKELERAWNKKFEEGKTASELDRELLLEDIRGIEQQIANNKKIFRVLQHDLRGLNALIGLKDMSQLRRQLSLQKYVDVPIEVIEHAIAENDVSILERQEKWDEVIKAAARPLREEAERDEFSQKIMAAWERSAEQDMKPEEVKAKVRGEEKEKELE